MLGVGLLRLPNSVVVVPASDAYPSPRVLVTDGLHCTVFVLDLADGTLIGQMGTKGTGPGQLQHPTGVAITADERVLVVDHNNHRGMCHRIYGHAVFLVTDFACPFFLHSDYQSM
jgi:hypothetical protein